MALASAFFAVSSFAAPCDDIKAAILAGGAADIAHAPHDIFLRGFTAATLRVKRRDLPDYVVAAIQMRPDLTAKIVARAMRTMAGQKRGFVAAVVARVIKVAIAANPDAAVAIARVAVEANPELISTILAAACAAAPEQRSQITAIGADFSVALLSRAEGDSAAEAWHINDNLNPANILDLRDSSGVNSPEQPPSH